MDQWWLTRTDVAIDDWKFNCEEKPPLPCGHGFHTCNITKQCVPVESVCDCDRNCCDGSDETDQLCEKYTRLDFEHGLANGWTQLKNDDFDFTLRNGRADRGDTGPSFDHTFRDEDGE